MTTNTPTPDLDRDALIKVIDALYDEAPSSPYDSGATSDGWCRPCEAIKDAIAALSPASGAEPVAVWREALEIIAGKRQCLDNLMSHAEVAQAALYAAPTPSSVVMEAWRDNLENAWAALHMIREAIGELFGPKASLEGPDAVLLRGPEPVHEAEAIVAALQRVAAPTPPSASSGNGELSREEQARALFDACLGHNLEVYLREARDVLDDLHEAGFRIVLAASSGDGVLRKAALEVLDHWNSVMDNEWTKDGVTWQARFPLEGYDEALNKLHEAVHAAAPIGDGELTRERAAHELFEHGVNSVKGKTASEVASSIYAAGFAIVRTAPSGEQG